MNNAEGMIKVIVSKDEQRVLGVHIVGPNASDLLTEAALAMRGEFTVEEVANTMHGHPTLSEAFEEALTLTLAAASTAPPPRKRNKAPSGKRCICPRAAAPRSGLHFYSKNACIFREACRMCPTRQTPPCSSAEGPLPIY